MTVKPLKTYKEQVALLRKRGCVVADETRAVEVLSKVNYYRLSGYFYQFRTDADTYKPGTTFERVASIYDFDRRLRAVLSLAIGNAEISARAEVAYFHAHKYGALGYLDAANFKSTFNASDFTNEFSDAIRRNGNDPIVKHHKMKYGGQFPLWVAVEFFTMGMTSRFYANLKRNDAKRIGDRFNASVYEMQSWLYCLTILRNACAHYDRLYATKFKAMPRFPVSFAVPADDSLFSQICVLKLLNRNDDEWRNAVVRDIAALISEYKQHIDLTVMGFPEKWKEILV
ncbi:CAAX amino protease [Synergistales bacterium]|nr:CAAX amino protease [Synergistales bacterium]